MIRRLGSSWPLPGERTQLGLGLGSTTTILGPYNLARALLLQFQSVWRKWKASRNAMDGRMDGLADWLPQLIHLQSGRVQHSDFVIGSATRAGQFWDRAGLSWVWMESEATHTIHRTNLQVLEFPLLKSNCVCVSHPAHHHHQGRAGYAGFGVL